MYIRIIIMLCTIIRRFRYAHKLNNAHVCKAVIAQLCASLEFVEPYYPQKLSTFISLFCKSRIIDSHSFFMV